MTRSAEIEPRPNWWRARLVLSPIAQPCQVTPEPCFNQCCVEMVHTVDLPFLSQLCLRPTTTKGQLFAFADNDFLSVIHVSRAHFMALLTTGSTHCQINKVISNGVHNAFFPILNILNPRGNFQCLWWHYLRGFFFSLLLLQFINLRSRKLGLTITRTCWCLH